MMPKDKERTGLTTLACLFGCLAIIIHEMCGVEFDRLAINKILISEQRTQSHLLTVPNQNPDGS